MFYGKAAGDNARLGNIVKVSASTARIRFGEAIRRARHGECIMVERDGRSEVAIISLDRLAAIFSKDHDKINAVIARDGFDDLDKSE